MLAYKGAPKAVLDVAEQDWTQGLHPEGDDWFGYVASCVVSVPVSVSALPSNMAARCAKTQRGDYGFAPCRHYSLGHYWECLGWGIPGGTSGPVSQDCIELNIQVRSPQHAFICDTMGR